MHYRRYDYIKKLLHHRGSPYVKVLYGPRGCGKTTILADFAFRMVRRGFPESRILVITIDDLGSASEDVSGSITWKKGAQFEEVSGDTFDLGNATEEEWQDLLHEIFAAMLGGF